MADRKVERVRMLVDVVIAHNGAKARAEALRSVREELGLEVHSVGTHGYYSVKTGRVRLFDPKKHTS